MTHSNHRQGTCESLRNDFVVLGFPGREFENLEETLERFKEIGARYHPGNLPEGKSRHTLVYENKEKVIGLLKELAAADLGISITVTGLYDQVTECCHAANLAPHTVNQSLGFWGNTAKLPHHRILEITTMCGHDRVSPDLVWHLARQVQRRALRLEEASRKMGKLCLCNAFNQVRAMQLINRLAIDMEQDIISEPQHAAKTNVAQKRDSGIIIDEARCMGCMECIPYCPVQAMTESSQGYTVIIDAERCTECGVCLQSAICPAEAIVAKDLTWPRTLRGKFQNMYAPYRGAPILAHISIPLEDTNEGHIYSSFKHRTELTNDVTGLVKRGETVISVELGRPHTGTTFKDVQKVIQALIPSGFKLDKDSPLTGLVVDSGKGNLKNEILKERAGRVILALTVHYQTIPQVLLNLRQVEKRINTVFAVNMLSVVNEDGSIQSTEICKGASIQPAPNCKTNVGLGRPLAKP